MAFILQPFPGTEIFEYAKNNNLLPEHFNVEDISGHHTFYSSDQNKISSIIKNEHTNEHLNLRCFFMVLVRYPWLAPIVNILIKLPYNRIYELIWHVTGITRIAWKYAGWSERKQIRNKIFMTLFKG